MKLRTLFCSLFCGLMAHSFAGDEIELFKLSTLSDGKQHRTTYKITATRFFSIPSWSGKEPIPLPLDKAIAIARERLPQEGINGTMLKNTNRELREIYLKSENNRWWYVIQFKGFGNSFMGAPKAIVVLMDGSTVDPEES